MYHNHNVTLRHDVTFGHFERKSLINFLCIETQQVAKEIMYDKIPHEKILSSESVTRWPIIETVDASMSIRVSTSTRV